MYEQVGNTERIDQVFFWKKINLNSYLKKTDPFITNNYKYLKKCAANGRLRKIKLSKWVLSLSSTDYKTEYIGKYDNEKFTVLE